MAPRKGTPPSKAISTSNSHHVDKRDMKESIQTAILAVQTSQTEGYNLQESEVEASLIKVKMAASRRLM